MQDSIVVHGAGCAIVLFHPFHKVLDHFCGVLKTTSGIGVLQRNVNILSPAHAEFGHRFEQELFNLGDRG